MNLTRMVALAAVALNLAACAGDRPTAAASRKQGKVVEIRTMSDERGNYFEPAGVHA